MFSAKLFARFRRRLHLAGQFLRFDPHKGYSYWEEAHFETPNRFGLRSTSHLVELGCDCGRVFWNISQHEKGPHE